MTQMVNAGRVNRISNSVVDAAKWSRSPPVARRSSGGGQARTICGVNGVNYAKPFNVNMLAVVMIEWPTGVANASEIARVDGVDVVLIGNNDLCVFSGFAQNDDRHQAMGKTIHDETRKAGKIFGQANANYCKGHPLSGTSFFFQNGSSKDGWVSRRRPGEEATPKLKTSPKPKT